MSRPSDGRLPRALRAVALATAWGVIAVGCGSKNSDATRTASGGAAGAAGMSGAGGSAGSGGAAAAAGTGTGGDAAADAAPDSDAAVDAGADVDVDASVDASADAEAGMDAAVDAPVSQFCGDGIRDPITEECDDGTGSLPADSCSLDCRVTDVLAVPPDPSWDGGPTSKVYRSLGSGRHPVGAGAQGYGVAFVTTPEPAKVGVSLFDAQGVPGPVVLLDEATTDANAAPVVAALPNGKLAVAWSDLGVDGSARGVVLRTVDLATGQASASVRLNTTTTQSQKDPDLIWTGSELWAAWVDNSQLTNGYFNDIVMRKLSATGVPQGGEVKLAATKENESRVALAPFAGSWAAVWRMGGGGNESLGAKAGSTSWTVPVGISGGVEDAPGIAEIDATHLLVVFTHDSLTTTRLSGAVLDMGAPGWATPFDITPMVAPYDSDATLTQTHPALVRAGDRVFVSWRSERLSSTSATGEELWLKEITWSSSGATVTLDLSSPEIPLPRSSDHQLKDQRNPALAATPLGPGGAIAAAWVDRGSSLVPSQSYWDVVSELIPVPVVRLPAFDGGTGQ